MATLQHYPFERCLPHMLLAAIVAIAGSGVLGCAPANEDSKVLDIEAPGVDIEVRDANGDTDGSIEIDTDAEPEATP